MRPRRRIPSFSRIETTSELAGPATAKRVAAIADLDSVSEPASEVEPCAPTRQIAFTVLPSHEVAGPGSGNLTVYNEGNEDNITPKAYTSHVPMSGRSSSPTKANGSQGWPLLTNRLQPRTPRNPVTEADNPSNLGTSFQPRHEKSLLPRVADLEAMQPPHEDFKDWYRQLPQAPHNAVSLPPSAHISPASSRSPSKHWVLNSETKIPCSPDFPPTDSTDLVLIPQDREVEFHVEAATVFHESPLLGDLIRPYITIPVGPGETEPEVNVYIVDEAYEILDAVLRFIHPRITKPSVRSITHLVRLLDACKRYGVARGLHTLGVLLIQFAGMAASPTNTNILIGSPIQCYGLACKFGFSNIAKLVSAHCLAVDPLKSDLGNCLAGVAPKDIRRLFDLHHSRALAALRLVDAAIDAHEFWCNGCSGLALWYDIWRQAAERELKSKPISKTVFSPSFIAGCLKQAAKKCPQHCMDHYLSPKAQLRFAVLQRDIDGLKDRI